jgi:hypothetical protein
MPAVRNTTVDNVAHRLFSAALVLAWVGVVTLVLLGGLNYYSTPLQERPFSDLHELYKPTGNVGHGLGIVGSFSMVVGVVFYSLRKHVGWLAGVGRLSTWLEVHIFLCTLGPVLVLFHTTFKFGGIVSIAFWSMTVVALSGVFGRYVYGRIPKTIHGHLQSLESIRQQEADLITAISDEYRLNPVQIETLFPRTERRAARGIAHALLLAAYHDFSRRSQKRHIKRLISRTLDSSDGSSGSARGEDVPRHTRDSMVRLALFRLRLEQQVVVMEPLQRVFGYWHVMHLPLAGVMFLVMIVHVTVSVLFGYTWVF